MAEDIPHLIGKFELTSPEHYDAYLGAVGMGPAQRALAVSAAPVDEFTATATGYRLRVRTALRTIIQEFELGVGFGWKNEAELDAKTTFTGSGDQGLVEVDLLEGGGAITVLWTPAPQGMTKVFSFGGATFTCAYKRIG
ncbi:lipocalin/fatty-acid binding family protein [Streptomyces sp. NBC_00503]|uniref:lipocalin/fatty-acid binding family protein n=1 Tax=Streptomyces sp. NBC_00503 TaxID=2903659 RepID=UPI002E81D416|nr:lipocalin/fatty-acid binding family protein [Streptomyces sp. NBC_00503]WUD83307.1 lipocalin/fatty-acid binding family protein [Streptomyces sp. NBC_00503]